MNWKKAVGFGFLFWVIMFAIVSALVALKFYGNIWGKVVTVVIGFVVAYVLANYAKPRSIGTAFGFGISWVIIGLILDFLITTRFEPNLFRFRSLWVGYLVVLLAPWVWQMFGGKTASSQPTPVA